MPENVTVQAKALSGKRVLIVHQQFAANALRNIISNCTVTCGTWFMQDERYAADGDCTFRTETAFCEAAMQADSVIADPMLRRAARDFKGLWIDFPHYAISGSAKW